VIAPIPLVKPAGYVGHSGITQTWERTEAWVSLVRAGIVARGAQEPMDPLYHELQIWILNESARNRVPLADTTTRGIRPGRALGRVRTRTHRCPPPTRGPKAGN
jgi:hypothetical protein